MGVSYSFQDKVSGEAISLNKIDEEICDYWDLPVNKDKYNFHFLDVTLIGVLADSTNQFLTKEDLAEYKAKSTAGWTDADWEFFEEFLINRYNFSAWRSW